MLYRQDIMKHTIHGMRVDCSESARKRGMTLPQYEAMVCEIFKSLPSSLIEEMIESALDEAEDAPRGEV